MADAVPPPQAPQGVNVINPEGDLVSIPAHTLAEAQDLGYRPATGQEVESYANEQQYGTPGQQAITALEGAGKAATFGLSVGAEKAFGVKPEDIRKRAETNPKAAMAGEMAGLVGSSFVPGLEGSVLAHAGEAGAAKLIPKAVTTGEKIGSSAAKGVIENALFASGDEVSKALAKDPDQTLSSALTNVGLGAAIGGGLGGAFGAVSPLWDATIGPRAESFLRAVRDRAEGTTLPVSEDLAKVLGGLEKRGIEIAPEMRAGLSEHPLAAEYFNTLRESGQAPGEALRGTIEKFKEDVGEQLKSALHTGENVTSHEAGEIAKESILNKVNELNDKIKAQYDAVMPANKTINVPDDAKLKFYDKLIETGQEFGAKGGPAGQQFKYFAERILPQSTIADLDKLATEVGNDWAMARRAGDFEKARALGEIKHSLTDFQDQQIAKAAKTIGKEGGENAEAIGRDLIKERKAARAAYANFIETLGEIAGAGKLGKVRSYSQMVEAVESIPSAKLADKLFDKKNIEKLNFLKENFPDVFETLVKQKKSQLLESATTKGDLMHNKILDQVNKLPREVQNLMFTDEQMALINSSGKILRGVNTRINPSGTARTSDALMKHMPAGIAAAVGILTGHNPLVGMMLGEGARFLGREAPETVKLSLLKFLGSSGPVDAGAWKAAADLIGHAQKGQRLIENSVKNVFKAGKAVLPQAMYPDERSLKKLDDKVTKYAQDPMQMLDLGGKTAHYMPGEAQSLAQMASRAVNFLNQVKPKEPPGTMFDTKPEISQIDKAAYNRNLTIAEQPLVVLEHIKNGELQPQDVIAIKSMYPSLYDKLSQGLVGEVINARSVEEPIPYRTRISMAMFMGQPLDGTMQPQAIQAAQSVGQISQAQNQAKGGQSPHRGQMGKLEKLSPMYMTPGQAAEANNLTKA